MKERQKAARKEQANKARLEQFRVEKDVTHAKAKVDKQTESKTKDSKARAMLAKEQKAKTVTKKLVQDLAKVRQEVSDAIATFSAAQANPPPTPPVQKLQPPQGNPKDQS